MNTVKIKPANSWIKGVFLSIVHDKMNMGQKLVQTYPFDQASQEQIRK